MSSRRFVENCPVISLATVQLQGGFIPGGAGRLNVVLSGDGRTWCVDVEFSLSAAAGLLRLSDGTGWSQWLKLCRRMDTRGRHRWFFEDKEETYQKAYFADGRFASRKAHGLTYHGEALSRSQRHWAKLADEEMTLRAAADRNEISEQQTDRLLAIEKQCEEAMSDFACKLEQPKLNKRARRDRFEQEVEDARRRLVEREEVVAPFDDQALIGIIAQLKGAAQRRPDLGDWRAKTDHGFVDQDRPHLNIAALSRLGLFVEGQRTVTHVGWGGDWNPKTQRQIHLIVDLTDGAEPYAVLLQSEVDSLKAQLFWTPQVRGDFNKLSRRFVDPHSGYVSKVLLFESGLFAVRRPS